MDGIDLPLVQWSVDTGKYNTRPISSVFHDASEELKCLVLNFCLYPMLAVPMSKDYFTGSGTSYYSARRALESLKTGGWVELALDYGVDIKRARVWRRTARFEKAFRMRVGRKLLVKEEALSKKGPFASASVDRGAPVSLIPGLETYSRLIEGVKLSMSDGSQVFRDIDLHRKPGGRIYAHGAYEYQNMPKQDRKKLIIGGEKVAELDYKSMHANMLLNREGVPCRRDLYEKILEKLELEVTGDGRDTVKTLTNASFNIKTPRGFAPMARLRKDKKGVFIMEYLGVEPSRVRAAITAAYPELLPYVCAGDHSAWLQQKESGVMVEVLETLAKKGVVALPLHDSVIVPRKSMELASRVMKDVYKRRNGFDIPVE